MAVYYVEDDDNIRQLVLYALKQAGIKADGARDDVEFRKLCKKKLPDVIILDIMLPGASGLEILERVRASKDMGRTPVMMVTAKNSELDVVHALDAGAYEYITKPFGMMEMVSRVRAMLRRAPEWNASSDSGSCSVGSIQLSTQTHKVKVDGKKVELTMREFDLLNYLMQSPGQVFSRDTLLKQVWGWDFSGGSRTVDMHVLTLRQKLGEAGSMIETVRGVGYRLSEEG